MRALIAEDEVVLANNVKQLLESELFEGLFEEVSIVDNGAAALQLIRESYDLLILDIKMPEVDGTQVIAALSEMSPHKRPLVILITAYPGAYETARMQIRMGVQALLQKPFELTELMGLVKELLGLRSQLLYLESQGVRRQCNWMLSLGDSAMSSVQVEGLLHFADICHLPWDPMDLHAASRKADVVSAMSGASELLHSNWKLQAKELGVSLFKKIFVGRIDHSFVAAGSTVIHPHDLRLTFACSRERLRLPFEFLNDGFDFIALRHPMKRFMTGIYSKRNASFANLLSELRDKRERLRILLVASNTLPTIDGVDREVEAVREYLRDVLPSNRVSIDYIPTEKATYDTVVNRLERCPYHVLHYAGHGHYDEQQPGNSSLAFWEGTGKRGRVRLLTVETLKNTLRLRGHSLMFVYLSCCSGTAHSDAQALLNNNFLGIADGLIQAGVPAVLGFRHPVSDLGARELARSFYISLPKHWQMDVALFEARCKLAGDPNLVDKSDWLSPILIAQNF